MARATFCSERKLSSFSFSSSCNLFSLLTFLALFSSCTLTFFHRYSTLSHTMPQTSCLCFLFFFLVSYSFLFLCRCPCSVFSYALSAPAPVPPLSCFSLIHLSFHLRLSFPLFCRLHLPLFLLSLFSLPSYFPLSDPSLNPSPFSEAVCDCNVCEENTVCQPESDR